MRTIVTAALLVGAIVGVTAFERIQGPTERAPVIHVNFDTLDAQRGRDVARFGLLDRSSERVLACVREFIVVRQETERLLARHSSPASPLFGNGPG